MRPNGKIKRYVDVIHGGHPQAFAGLAILAPLDVLMTMPPRRQHPTDGAFTYNNWFWTRIRLSYTNTIFKIRTFWFIKKPSYKKQLVIFMKLYYI